MTDKSAVIVNVFADDNKGGAAITRAAVEATQRALPEAPLVLVAVESDAGRLSSTHRYTIGSFPDADLFAALVATGERLGGLVGVSRSILLLGLPKALLPRHLRTVASAKVVVSKGGYIFVDRRNMRHLMSQWLTMFPILLAIRHRVPTVLLATSVGPFTSRAARMLNSAVLRRVTTVLPRDGRSAVVCRELGVEPNRLRQVPDSVFSLAPPTVEEVAVVLKRLNLTGDRFACVSMRPRRGRGDMLRAAVADAVRGLLLSGQIDKVLVVPQVTGDMPASERLVAELDDPRIHMVREDLGPTDLIALYSASVVGIATRLHHGIFSLLGGTPVAMVSIEGVKTEGVLDDFGLTARLVVPLEQVGNGRLRRTALDALEHEAGLRTRILHRSHELRMECEVLHQEIRRATSNGRNNPPDRR